MTRLQLLLVDDDRVDRQAVTRTLRRTSLQFEVTEVSTLGEARELLGGERSFDCVLLDYRLPDGEGIELLRPDEAAGWGGVPAPVVVLTGHDDAQLADGRWTITRAPLPNNCGTEDFTFDATTLRGTLTQTVTPACGASGTYPVTLTRQDQFH